jgi:hypothetical protein
VKVLEKLLLPFALESLSRAASQHGYRSVHSTTMALLPLTTRIAIGLNKAKPADRTAVVALHWIFLTPSIWSTTTFFWRKF